MQKYHVERSKHKENCDTTQKIAVQHFSMRLKIVAVIFLIITQMCLASSDTGFQEWHKAVFGEKSYNVIIRNIVNVKCRKGYIKVGTICRKQF